MLSKKWNAEELKRAESKWILRLDQNQIEAVREREESLTLDKLTSRIETLLYDGPGICLLKNAPINTENDAKEFLYALGQSLGYVVSQTKNDERVVSVEDAGGDVSKPTQRGHKTGSKLPYHVDRTDVIVLMCIRQAETGGESSLVSSKYAHDVMQKEDPELLKQLKSPLPHDRRGEEGPNESPWDLLPVFSEQKNQLVCRYIRRFYESSQRHPDAPRITSLQYKALDALDKILERDDVHYKMSLEPGDIQIIENHGVLHSREGFRDKSNDGRLLLRLWLATERSPSLPIEYKNLYGDVNTGVVRGGIWINETNLGQPVKTMKEENNAF